MRWAYKKSQGLFNNSFRPEPDLCGSGTDSRLSFHDLCVLDIEQFVQRYNMRDEENRAVHPPGHSLSRKPEPAAVTMEPINDHRGHVILPQWKTVCGLASDVKRTGGAIIRESRLQGSLAT
ncbi:hypothetical protein RRG08_040887 [Elysia crispata]|uniref:Uncharacterized protein n=1 Tax=Elysia crispata TaxID=231223 RepID=A0AAE1E8J1_9GAST|nr:hypothetical protein RRG08_040887 [Elysia crispata]